MYLVHKNARTKSHLQKVYSDWVSRLIYFISSETGASLCCMMIELCSESRASAHDYIGEFGHFRVEIYIFFKVLWTGNRLKWPLYFRQQLKTMLKRKRHGKYRNALAIRIYLGSDKAGFRKIVTWTILLKQSNH